MAKDKRLLITRAIVQHVVRKEGAAKAEKIGVFLHFVVSPRVIKLHGNVNGGAGDDASAGGTRGNEKAGSNRPNTKGGVPVGGNASGKNPAIGASTVGSTWKSPSQRTFGASISSAVAPSGQQQHNALPDFATKLYLLPNPVYPSNETRKGQTTCLIVGGDIITDCLKINKRYRYYDAVLSIKSISKYGSEECIKKGVQVANAFQRFVIDHRVVKELPRAIAAHLLQVDNSAAASTASSSNTTSGAIKKAAHTATNVGPQQDAFTSLMSPATKSVTLLTMDKEVILDEGEDLPFVLSQGSKGQTLHVQMKDGRCMVRVGHAGMSAGDICANIAQFTSSLKTLFPTLFRSVTEFKLYTAITEPIRYMATNAA